MSPRHCTIGNQRFMASTCLCHQQLWLRKLQKGAIPTTHAICDCPPENVSVIPGRPVVFIKMKGRYDLTLPELRCGGCCASWTPGLYDVQVSGYWPATIHFHTIYDVAIFQDFREMKLAAPGISRLTFMRVLEAQTTAHGRTGKVCSDTFFKSFMEWVISSYEVDKLCSEQPFACTACSPQMLAVSVDGNRKHYRFKKDGHSEEGGYFEGVLICKDDEVAAFVDDLQKRAKHVRTFSCQVKAFVAGLI
ncbi:uncharacterized protein LOC115587640 [Sparus aurata]|uniref:uncharacterized protein LOC115587640 n=1 Tax=Sparus aurata TaxID=8175 RepID=UPI0011C176C2|nr:uncharacterized protein LOC115587640 [Sparus aurata]